MDEQFLALVINELTHLAREELLDEIIASLDWDEEFRVRVVRPLERRPADRKIKVNVRPDGDVTIAFAGSSNQRVAVC